MAVTSILPPSANTAIGSALSDGNTYSSWSYATRMYSGGSNACVATSPNIGTMWSGCFSSTIPTTATITGVELVGSGNSRFGNAGSTSSGETFTYMMRFYNGSSYSAPLAFLSTPTGGSLNGDSTELTLDGTNRYYVNNTSGTDVLAGANNSLSGISWNPSDQANFGFAIYLTAETGSAVAVILGEGNMGLRVTYSEQFPDKVIGEPPADILKVNGIAAASLANIAQPGNTVEPTPYQLFYQFESETPQTNAGSDWSPGNSWVNGSSATDGTYWGRDSNKTVKGWNCDTGTTPSTSTGTGPNNGVDVSDGTHASSTKYLYTEVSTYGGVSRATFCFVARMPVFNSDQMVDSGNDLDLKFWVHAYGSQIGDLYVYIDDATSSNHSSATELAAYESWSGFSSQSSDWQEKTISLNSYRNDTNYYIYFVSQNATGFRGDLAIDAVQIIES